MRITRKREPVIFYYKLIGHTLESALHYPYLGVELTSTLDWSHHIDNKVCKHVTSQPRPQGLLASAILERKSIKINDQDHNL